MICFPERRSVDKLIRLPAFQPFLITVSPPKFSIFQALCFSVKLCLSSSFIPYKVIHTFSNQAQKGRMEYFIICRRSRRQTEGMTVGLTGLYEMADIIVSRTKFWVKSQTYWTVVPLHHYIEKRQTTLTCPLMRKTLESRTNQNLEIQNVM